MQEIIFNPNVVEGGSITLFKQQNIATFSYKFLDHFKTVMFWGPRILQVTFIQLIRNIIVLL